MLTKRRVVGAVVFSVGIAVGLAITAVQTATCNKQHPVRSPMDEVTLNAFAAHGSDSFAIATGPVDGHLEGIFCLDFRSGDLTGYVLSPRNGKFLVAYKTSILKDLPMEQGKTPKYAMVLGKTDAAAFRLKVQIGGSIIYVADCNTGRVAAYAFPWSEVPNVSGDELVAEPM